MLCSTGGSRRAARLGALYQVQPLLILLTSITSAQVLAKNLPTASAYEPEP
jgi:hypothetical protein